VLNIIVIDITNLELPDQMYLYYELNRCIKDLPAGQPVAIYWQSGEHNLMLQNFTTDRELLSAAVRKAIPRFPPPARGLYVDTGFIALQAIEHDFEQYPGRKNILLFSGGSSLFLHPDPMAYPDPERLRSIYDELEASRIAIYPVDARGLQVVFGRLALAVAAQQGLMQDVANATGGAAFYNNNGLDKITARWLDHGGSFYTLTYSPSDFHFDHKWHNVKVKLTGDNTGYTLSYRRGYFADNTIAAPRKEKNPRTLLLADGSTVATPDTRSIPLVFEARVEPASSTNAAASPNTQPPKKRTIPYSIRYSLPADAFTVKTVDGKSEIDIGVAVFAFNNEGSLETRLADRFTIGVNKDRLRLDPEPLIPAQQQINLHKGQKYLYLAVWDMTSGRLGTLQVPLQVTPARKTHKL
jgi:VWFA-related protein